MKSNHDAAVTSDCQIIEAFIPEYAFGLTNPAETQLVESNLVRCPEAASQLADYQRLQDELRAGVPQFELPRQLEDRLMATIAEPVPVAAPTPRRRSPVRWVGLAAAIAFLALVATNLYWLSRVNDLTRQQNELAARLGGQPNNAFVLASTSNLRGVRLPPSEKNGDASAFLMWNAESEIGILYVSGFPKPAVGRTYQLWLTRGQEFVSAGTLRVDEEGKGALLFHIKEPIDKYTWARITAEPESGSPAPSDNVVVVGKLTI
ncbi:MAG: anti-sigma factor [Anaerolineae bacterium]|nr:anti-sigma factor [Anaerolineae bacterium]